MLQSISPLRLGADRETTALTSIDMLLLEKLGDFLSVVQEAHAHRNDNDLPRREPERPLARKVLAENSGETLNTASHGTVDHNRAGISWSKWFLNQERLLLSILLILIVGACFLRSWMGVGRFRLVRLMGMGNLCSLVLE